MKKRSEEGLSKTEKRDINQDMKAYLEAHWESNLEIETNLKLIKAYQLLRIADALDWMMDAGLHVKTHKEE